MRGGYLCRNRTTHGARNTNRTGVASGHARSIRPRIQRASSGGVMLRSTSALALAVAVLFLSCRVVAAEDALPPLRSPSDVLAWSVKLGGSMNPAVHVRARDSAPIEGSLYVTRLGVRFAEKTTSPVWDRFDASCAHIVAVTTEGARGSNLRIEYRRYSGGITRNSDGSLSPTSQTFSEVFRSTKTDAQWAQRVVNDIAAKCKGKMNTGPRGRTSSCLSEETVKPNPPKSPCEIIWAWKNTHLPKSSMTLLRDSSKSLPSPPTICACFTTQSRRHV
jgi:hypothetical protein